MHHEPLAHVTLRGRHVVLEPLDVAHADALVAAVAADDDVWTYLPSAPRTFGEMRAWIEARQRGLHGLPALAFAQRDARTGALVGSSSLFDIDLHHLTGEIGFTWIAASHRRTGVNTEAKLLLLTHAFEALGLRRVQLKTDALNERSRRAIERLGARFEGVLRRHMTAQGGRVRDTAMYSVIDAEWPAVRDRLRALLDR